jgi:hypothetical protein
MKQINSDCFTAKNSVRSMATIAALVLCLSAACGEDLTTLDGKTYTNITEFAKYPNQVFFTCNDKRIRVAVTNLPEDFRTKHGIVAVTNEAHQKTAVQVLSPDDLFLAQHSYSDFEVKKDVSLIITNGTEYVTNFDLHVCSVQVNAKGFEFAIYTYSCNPEGLINLTNSHSDVLATFGFKFGEEDSARQIFEKFVEWESTAAKNNVESFKKQIASLPTDDAFGGQAYRSFEFQWEKDSPVRGNFSQLNVSYPITHDWPLAYGYLSEEDVVAFEELLKSVPTLKRELVQKIRNQESQQSLFR